MIQIPDINESIQYNLGKSQEFSKQLRLVETWLASSRSKKDIEMSTILDGKGKILGIRMHFHPEFRCS